MRLKGAGVEYIRTLDTTEILGMLLDIVSGPEGVWVLVAAKISGVLRGVVSRLEDCRGVGFEGAAAGVE